MSGEDGARGYVVRERYEAIPRRVLQQEGISARALGVLVYLLSKPDGWRSSATRIAQHFSEGRDAIEKALKTLEELGYLGRQRVRYASGRCGWVWVYGDNPEYVAVNMATRVAEIESERRRPETETGDGESPQVAPNPGEPNPGNPSSAEPDSVHPKTGSSGSFREDRSEITETEQEPGGQVTGVRHPRERAAQCEPKPASVFGDAQDFATARVQRNRNRHGRGAAALNETAHLPASRPIVDRFAAECPVPLAPGVVAKWRASVAELLRLDVPVPVIEQAMAECRAAGLSPSLLADVAAQVGNRDPAGRRAAQPQKPSTTTIRLAETESLRAWARAEDEAEAAALAAGRPVPAIGAGR